MQIRSVRPWICLALFAFLLTCLSILVQTRNTYRPRIMPLEAAGPRQTALILGASIKLDGTPSDALRDRVETGIRLYKTGKVQRLLMTGDDGAFHANEVATMKRLAIEAGVPEEDIVVDGHGYRTYESCKRAVQVFDMKDNVIIVTQTFHLYRALYLCSELGMKDVEGVSADLQAYERIVFFTLRDWAATIKGWWDINILPPASPVKY